MKGLRALSSIMEAQWIYNPRQVNQPLSSLLGNDGKREREKKKTERTRELVGIEPCSVRLPVYR